jgi:hypothetical protein
LPLPGVIVSGGAAAALPLPCNDWSKASNSGLER